MMCNVLSWRVRLVVAMGLGFAMNGCSFMLAKGNEPAAFYSLDDLQRGSFREVSRLPGLSSNGLTLIVEVPVADASFDSPHMMYVRQAHQLEYFAHSLWIDTPARMLAPLILNAVVTDGNLISKAVPSSSAAIGDIRLITEIVRLQQDFSIQPSKVRFTLRATLLNETTRNILGVREFDESVPTLTDDPYGGVVAANQAVNVVLVAVADFCNQAATNRKPVANGLGN